MSSDPSVGAARIPLVGSDELKRSWGWILGLGIVLILVGTIAIGSATLMTLASVVLFGWLMIVAGAMEVVQGFWRRRWGGFFLDLLTGVLYLVVGFMIVANPGATAVALTLIIAMFLLFGGLIRIVTALSVQMDHWVWLLVGGGVNVLLGILIWRQWPISGLWVIGLFIGIEMLMNGWSLVMLSIAARSLPDEAAANTGNP